MQISLGDDDSTITEVTSTPVTRLDKYLGVGDAWALIRAADRAWDVTEGKWVTLLGGNQETKPF